MCDRELRGDRRAEGVHLRSWIVFSVMGKDVAVSARSVEGEAKKAKD